MAVYGRANPFPAVFHKCSKKYCTERRVFSCSHLVFCVNTLLCGVMEKPSRQYSPVLLIIHQIAFLFPDNFEKCRKIIQSRGREKFNLNFCFTIIINSLYYLQSRSCFFALFSSCAGRRILNALLSIPFSFSNKEIYLSDSINDW